MVIENKEKLVKKKADFTFGARVDTKRIEGERE